jgi:peptidoglycan/LPS O-acetylase OafA/YrhL
MGIIRFLLALSVVTDHEGAIFGFKFVGGRIAVQSFYMISGFYMSLVLNEKYIGVNKSYRLFITNRFIRLYPIYWTVLIITFLICIASWIVKGHPLILESYLSVTPNLASFAYLIIANIIIFGQDVALFLGINPKSGALFFTSDFLKTHPALNSFIFVRQAWTLAVELTFYLVAPFIVRRKPGIVIGIIALSLLLRLYLYNALNLQHDPWTYRFFPTEIMFFLIGYLCYKIYLKFKPVQIPVYISIATLSFIIIFTFIYNFIPETRAVYSPFSYKEVVYFGSLIPGIPVLFMFLKRNKLDNNIGELSYPMYISHMLVGLVCNTIAITFIRSGLCIAIITVIFAYILNKLIADPVERFRQSRLH